MDGRRIRRLVSALCTVRAAQAGDTSWRAATSATQTLQLRAGTLADLTIAVDKAPGLEATAPLAATITVASAPGAVQTPGTTAGTTVLTWKAPSVTAGTSITYSVTLVDRPPSTTIDAKATTSATDPTPANNSLTRTLT